mgnify:CR=1 FL=1
MQLQTLINRLNILKDFHGNIEVIIKTSNNISTSKIDITIDIDRGEQYIIISNEVILPD